MDNQTAEVEFWAGPVDGARQTLPSPPPEYLYPRDPFPLPGAPELVIYCRPELHHEDGVWRYTPALVPTPTYPYRIGEL